MGDIGDISKPIPRLLELLYNIFLEVDPVGSVYVDVREPLEVWNYIIYTTPVVLFVVTCMFVSFPIVLNFVHWAPKLLWPRLIGFPMLHELLRRLEHITDPRLPTIGDIIRLAEGTLYDVLFTPEDER